MLQLPAIEGKRHEHHASRLNAESILPHYNIQLDWHDISHLEVGEEVRTEDHVVLQDDGMLMSLLKEDPIQSPFVMLREVGMARLQSACCSSIELHKVHARRYPRLYYESQNRRSFLVGARADCIMKFT